MSRAQGLITFSIPCLDNAKHKAEVLQYKANSSNLTKKQRYSKIMNRRWSTRPTVFATQSLTYTNPNTHSFLRMGAIIILPNNIAGLPNNAAGPFSINAVNPFNCPTNSITVGGTLNSCVTITPQCNQ